MSWDTLQQLIRIVGYAGGAAVFGDAVADGEMFQQALGGAVSVAAFIWWMFHQASKS